jgi:hypothetical protein
MNWLDLDIQVWTLWFSKMDYLLYVVYMYYMDIGCTNMDYSEYNTTGILVSTNQCYEFNSIKYHK